ncbi:hypothetical protein QTL86_03505 [Cellulosilyticum sp. ST5]|uniref:hypothetical protein n=1 Tax=Cellulosilyticum sp. ST5 TaxID=3055805 RepID=UPI003977B78E
MGFAIGDFWDTTPYEFSIIAEGYAERKQQDYDLAITQAYLTSRWVWAKKLPDLKKLIGKKGPKKAMTDDQMMKMCMALNKLYRGEVKENGN